jgi:hypothetical protein
MEAVLKSTKNNAIARFYGKGFTVNESLKKAYQVNLAS